METKQRHSNVTAGRNAVLELLRSERPVDSLLLQSDQEPSGAKLFIALAKQKGAIVKRVSRQALDAMCETLKHQGVAAVGSFLRYASLTDILSIAELRGERPLIVVTDGIEDPHNLGAVIRVAEAAGAHGVVLRKRASAQLDAVVERASAGAVSHIAICRAANLAYTIRELKEEGLFCYAADSAGDLAYETDLTGPVALVVGSEGRGVSRLVAELCDRRVALPMKGKVGSLNVSVATGALLYEIVRQRMVEAGRV